MDYTALTTDQRAAKWRQALLNLEDQHDTLDMECVCILAAVSGATRDLRAEGEQQIAEKRRIQSALTRQIAAAHAAIARLTESTDSAT